MRGHGEVFEARKKAYSGPRWHIACINWSHPMAPHAVAYFFEGVESFHKYFATWAEAVEWTDATIRSLAK